MSHMPLPGLALAAVLAALAGAPAAQTGPAPSAQPAPASARPAATAAADPADPRAAVPAPVYRSVLAGLPPGAEPPAAVPWRAANDQVGRIGGWKAYAREAAAPSPAASAPHPHGGHR